VKLVKETRSLALALAFMSLGGLVLHVRVHPSIIDPDGTGVPANWIPFVAGLVGVFVTPFLLSLPKTVIVGYLINGMSVILGTILMSTKSLSAMPVPLTFGALLFKTTFSDILLLFGKLFVGHQIFLYHHPAGMGRMFTTGWWARHFFYLATVFAIGHFIWR